MAMTGVDEEELEVADAFRDQDDEAAFGQAEEQPDLRPSDGSGGAHDVLTLGDLVAECSRHVNSNLQVQLHMRDLQEKEDTRGSSCMITHLNGTAWTLQRTWSRTSSS